MRDPESNVGAAEYEQSKILARSEVIKTRLASDVDKAQIKAQSLFGLDALWGNQSHSVLVGWAGYAPNLLE